MFALLLEAALKGSLILGLAALLVRWLRKASAAARHLTWGIALLAAVLLPLASRVLPPLRVRLPAAVVLPQAATNERIPERIAPTVADLSMHRTATPPLSGPSVPPGPPALPPTRGLGLTLPSAVTLAWALVAVLLFGRLLTGIVRLARLTRRATGIDDPSWLALLADAARAAGVTRPVRLLASERIGVPITWGVLRPVVLLPPDHDEWSTPRRRTVLIHELAHVARRDAVTHLGAELSCALYWFNPLVWLAARELRSQAERACDDRVLAAGTVASSYAGELLDIARSSLGHEVHAVALAMARRSELEGRLLAILNPTLRRSVPARLNAVLLALGALAVALPLAAFRPARARDLGAPVRPAEHTVTHAPETRRPAPPSAGHLRSPDRGSKPAVQAIPVTAAQSPCDWRGTDSEHSHSSSNWSESDGHNKSWRVSWSGNGCDVDLVARGEVKFNADFTDVSEISAGGYLEITVREGGTTRRIEFQPQGGTMRRTYTINGTAAPYDQAAQEWLAAFLVELDRHTAFAVDARFPALLKQGVAAVLDEIDKMKSDYARGVYDRKLLAEAKLSPSEVRRVATTAGKTIDSDYELRQVLGVLAAHYSLADTELRNAFIDAATTLQSDYERSELLLVVVGKSSITPEAGHTIVKLVGGMQSDYEKSRVLLALGEKIRGPLIVVDNRPQPGTFTLGSEYLGVVAGMQSDYERGRVLQLIVGSGQLSSEALQRVFDVVGQMESSYEAANVLVAVAEHNKLEGTAREAFLKAADRIKSDYDGQRARAALRSPGGTRSP